MSAPKLFNRFAISSYPRLIEYTLRKIEEPLAANIPISIITAGRNAGGQMISAGLNFVRPFIYTL